jgi:hypothetical protein
VSARKVQSIRITTGAPLSTDAIELARAHYGEPFAEETGISCVILFVAKTIHDVPVSPFRPSQPAGTIFAESLFIRGPGGSIRWEEPLTSIGELS